MFCECFPIYQTSKTPYTLQYSQSLIMYLLASIPVSVCDYIVVIYITIVTSDTSHLVCENVTLIT